MEHNTKPIGYPFSAVVGQDSLKLALLLVAVDPAIGGLLIVGERGSGKSTLARGVAELLGDSSPFIELPVGSTEDRVVGSLDLGVAMSESREEFKPGLMIQADCGVIYIDEVNLLQDHIVDLLLDSAASGVVRVERDGFSISRRSRFVLCGSMNPEEGELRPQLLDRFGISVVVGGLRDLKTRSEAVTRRIRFDEDPIGFVSEFVEETEAIKERVKTARSILAMGALDLSDLVRLSNIAARISLAAGVEGMRADLAILRSARAYAALDGRSSISEDDLYEVAPFALAHRTRKHNDSPPVTDPSGRPNDRDGSSKDTGSDEDKKSEAELPDSASAGENDDRASDSDMTAGPTQTSGGDFAGPEGELANQDIDDDGGVRGFHTRGIIPRSAARSDLADTSRKVKPGVGVTTERQDGAPLAVRESLISGVKAKERLDSGVAGRSFGQLLFRRLLVSEERCVLFVIDCSGSMGANSRIETARTAIDSLLGDSYVKRHSVAIVSFSGSQSEVALMPTRSIEVADARLEQLRRGGKTPLHLGLLRAIELSKRLRSKGVEPFWVLLTDGMASWAPSGESPVDLALDAAHAVAESSIEGIVLDFDSDGGAGFEGLLKVGISQEIAAASKLGYLRLE